MWKVTNTVNDREKQHLHRLASKLTYEPSIGGFRLRLGASIELDDAHFEAVRYQLEGWKSKGIVDFEHIGGETKPPVETKTPEVEKKPPVEEKVVVSEALTEDRKPGHTQKVAAPTETATEVPGDSAEGINFKKSPAKKKLI